MFDYKCVLDACSMRIELKGFIYTQQSLIFDLRMKTWIFSFYQKIQINSHSVQLQLIENFSRIPRVAVFLHSIYKFSHFMQKP